MTSTTNATPEPLRDLVIRDVAVLDCTGREPSGRHDVVVRDGTIASIHRHAAGATVRGAREIDGAGTTLMPGLTDAHVHFALIGQKGDHGDEPLIDHVLRVAQYIDGALDEGFTTVRDAGGLEPAWAKAVEKAWSAARGSCRRGPSCPRPAATATTAPPTTRSTTARRSRA